MKSIRAFKPGTTVVQKLNQGFSRRLGVLPACRQTGAAGPFLVTSYVCFYSPMFHKFKFKS